MPFAAHPRSHGEHQEFTPGVELVVGSSPLARGTQPAGVFIIRVRRLIPARAGNTGLGVLWLRIGAAHPRSRGEHCALSGSRWIAHGSSPLARGTQKKCTAPESAVQAHPRSRGEHYALPGGVSGFPGSSPLARGTLHQLREAITDRRLIPARAGNTRSSPQGSNSSSAHPRSRGEHQAQILPYPALSGSSPLARGTHCRIVQITIPRRLIPARAGNTSVYVLMSPPQPAHPRSRGEHVTWSSSGEFGCGSSPLARGTR